MTQGAQTGALRQPRGVAWGRRWEAGSREDADIPMTDSLLTLDDKMYRFTFYLFFFLIEKSSLNSILGEINLSFRSEMIWNAYDQDTPVKSL